MIAQITPQVLPALRALDAYPLLRAVVAPSLEQQYARIAERVATFAGRHATLDELHQILHTAKGGLVALEGPPGSGVTTILAYLATQYPATFWFGNDDAGQGAAALYAQLVAMYRPSVPLITPVVERDPLAIEQLLNEISTNRTASMPLIVLIDPPATTNQPHNPLPLPLPLQLPPGVLVVYATTPDERLPWTAQFRVRLPLAGLELAREQVLFLQRHHCPPDWIAPLCAAAQGSYLYLRLALPMAHAGWLNVRELPLGLEALYAAWWQTLDEPARQLALVLAAAGEPLPLDLAAELLGSDPTPHLAQWTALGLAFIESRAVAPPPNDDEPSTTEATQHFAAFYHWTTRDYLARSLSADLAATHARLAALAQDITDGPSDIRTDYLARHFSRHAALGPTFAQMHVLPRVVQRDWIVAQERRSGQHAAAANDLAWELDRAVTNAPEEPQELGPLLRLVRSAALAGTLATRARTLSPDAALAALGVALERRGREVGLKRVLDLVEQLPDGQDKALVLRQLGDACYALNLRSSAMRLLSRALDLEEQRFPRTWRDQREQLHSALVSAALSLGAVEVALTISARISHNERRGMAETQVARWLLEQYAASGATPLMTQARRVACAITHEGMGAWARAEVAVALARAGDQLAAEELLNSVTIETANAWAQIELACDSAPHDEDAARRRINALRSPNQRDRGLARLAHALALADKDGDALAAAEQIGDVEVRVAALLDLRLTLEGLVAMLALERATAEIDVLTGDARVPLLAALAAAHAALGRRERALGIAEQLAEGEERDRALSRVAVAFAQQGDYVQAQATARALEDDDERDWAFDELTRLLAAAGHWSEAERQAEEIKANDQRARTQAELAIARSRADDPLAALQMALSIDAPGERARALTMIAPLLVGAGGVDAAIAIGGGTKDMPAQHSPFTTLDARSRYLAAVAVGLAECGQLDQAQVLTTAALRPLDRARVNLAIARAAALHDRKLAYATLGAALRTAALGRDEAFRVLEQAAPVLARLGGADLLAAVAAAVDEVDSW